ncbi:MAG: EAL domain-containing protein [Phycisphaerae bacterium]
MRVNDNRRVLVIDDNESIHEDFRKILVPPARSQGLSAAEAALFGSAPTVSTPLGFEVDGALQGQRGYEIVSEAAKADTPYALAFVDMRMPPGWDGLETIENLWKVDPDLQVVICTAYADYSWDEVTSRLGQSDKLLLLKKPFDGAEVWQLASALTEKWNVSRSARAKLHESEQLARALEHSNRNLQQQIVERKAAEEQLRHNAYHDVLTGLPNRAYLMDRLNQCIERASRDADYRFALLFLDVDNFKLINDSLGHDKGDELLVQLADRLRTCLRALDALTRVDDEAAARIGGDEFVVLLDGLRQGSDSALVAQRLLERISGAFDLGGQTVTIGASIGIAVSDQGYTKADEMLRDSDTAMYRAKTAGKARYAMFDPEMHRAAKQRLNLENELRQAIPNNELRLLFQPIVQLPSREIVGYEALTRWERGGRAGGMPEQFIPVAEDSGLIIPIGRWVIDEACRCLRGWRGRLSADRNIYISVNVSRRQLSDPGLASHVARAIANSGLVSQWVNLEVTEGGVIDDFGLANDRLRELRDLGVGLHMDDFGTGYSSLSVLHRLPFSVVKVDRAFTATMRDNANYANVISAVISLAHCLRMKVTVEGVECEDQLDLITDLGCDFAQGFYFSRPVDSDTALAQLISGTTFPTLDGDEALQACNLGASS